MAALVDREHLAGEPAVAYDPVSGCGVRVASTVTRGGAIFVSVQFTSEIEDEVSYDAIHDVTLAQAERLREALAAVLAECPR